MGLEYVNRRGDRYYILQGVTKTGKPKYYCSRKPEGVPVDELPDDFEVYENPGTKMVSVRKKIPSQILPSECEFLKQEMTLRAKLEFFMMDVRGDSVVVLLPDIDPVASVQMLERLLGPFASRLGTHDDWTVRNVNYSPMMRLTLEDAAKRLFTIERWCFRIFADGWITLDGNEPLDVLTRKYFKHLGKESFYDLI